MGPFHWHQWQLNPLHSEELWSQYTTDLMKRSLKQTSLSFHKTPCESTQQQRHWSVHYNRFRPNVSLWKGNFWAAECKKLWNWWAIWGCCYVNCLIQRNKLVDETCCKTCGNLHVWIGVLSSPITTIAQFGLCLSLQWLDNTLLGHWLMSSLG